MKRLFVLFGLLVLAASPVRAQFATKFSWGATVPMFKIALAEADSTDSRTDFLAAGAGAFFAANLAPTPDGRWRMVTFALPVFVNYDNGVGFDAGLTLGTLNNLLSVGIATPLVAGGEVVKDVFSRESTYLLISASLNFGAGGGGNPEQIGKATAGGPVHSRPPGYVGW